MICSGVCARALHSEAATEEAVRSARNVDRLVAWLYPDAWDKEGVMRSAEMGASLLLWKQVERRQRFHVEPAARSEAKARLKISEREVHCRSVKTIDFVPVISLPHQDYLRPAHDVLLHLRRRACVRSVGKKIGGFDARRLGGVLGIARFRRCRARGRRCCGRGSFFEKSRRRWARCLGGARGGSCRWLRREAERLQRLGIQLARDLEPVADLLTPDGRGRVRIFFAVDFAVIKSRVFQFLLRGFDRRIGPGRGPAGQKNKSRDE